MKKCSRCLIEKSVDSFYKNRKYKGGYIGTCKECHSILVKKNRQTQDGLISSIYAGQKGSSKTRGHSLPNYTKQEFSNWIQSQDNFEELYNNWKESGYETKLRPSCDRLNDYKGYSLDNIQLITWKENKIKGHEDMKNGINRKGLRAIAGINIKTKDIVVFYSISECGRKLNIDVRAIGENLGMKQPSTQGWIFVYIEDKDLLLNKLDNFKPKRKSIVGVHKKTLKVVTYESITDASKDLGIDRKGINNCCLGITKSSGGYKWN